MNYIEKNNLKIDSLLFEFINKEVIPGKKIQSEDYYF